MTITRKTATRVGLAALLASVATAVVWKRTEQWRLDRRTIEHVYRLANQVETAPASLADDHRMIKIMGLLSSRGYTFDSLAEAIRGLIGDADMDPLRLAWVEAGLDLIEEANQRVEE